ncbi:hypothetical protein [Streptomyces sp. NPDC006334]|uniref:hypothetical protein n=1 Tax=Streptomyces sp. NPDC006334 TaxID=3156754 RepID=UPI0033B9AEB5
MTGTTASLSRVDGAWAQTGVLTFSRTLAGADRAWEVITEVPAVTIPRAGVWEVNVQARGVAALPPATVGAGAGITVGVYKNGALIPGTETLAVFQSEAAGDQGDQVQATGSRQLMHSFAAGDTVQLAAYRIGTTGTTSIVSNGDGRVYVTAHWVAPEGDMPT